MHSAIVVGAGTSGAIVARRLVDAGVEVTLFEAGGYDTNPAIHDPSRAGELGHSAEDWDCFTVPQEHAGGRRLHLPRGKVTGGSHALNAMIWVRGAASDYDGWEKAGATGRAWSEVEPLYDAIEHAGEWGATEAYPGPEVSDADVEDWVRRTAIPTGNTNAPAAMIAERGARFLLAE